MTRVNEKNNLFNETLTTHVYENTFNDSEYSRSGPFRLWAKDDLLAFEISPDELNNIIEHLNYKNRK